MALALADLGQQLSELLGRGVSQNIRKTNDKDPPRVSIIDVIMVIKAQDAKAASVEWCRLADRYPEVSANCTHVKFPGKGQKSTPVADVKGIVDRRREKLTKNNPLRLCAILCENFSLKDHCQRRLS